MESKDITSAIDRTQVSSSGAAYIVQATAKATAAALGVTEFEEIFKIGCSRASIHNHRSQNRTEIAADIKAEFVKRVPGRYVLHWDGKLLPSTAGEI